MLRFRTEARTLPPRVTASSTGLRGPWRPGNPGSLRRPRAVPGRRWTPGPQPMVQEPATPVPGCWCQARRDQPGGHGCGPQPGGDPASRHQTRARIHRPGIRPPRTGRPGIHCPPLRAQPPTAGIPGKSPTCLPPVFIAIANGLEQVRSEDENLLRRDFSEVFTPAPGSSSGQALTLLFRGGNSG